MSTTLDLWPQSFEDTLKKRLERFQDQHGRASALFDADETLWHGDIVEAHYALLEVTRPDAAFEFVGHPAVEHLERESLVAYYQRLYAATNVDVAFEWACDVYDKHPTSALLSETVELFDRTRRDLDNLSYPRPKFYEAQRQLLVWLNEHDVDAWIISASPEVLIHAAVLALDLKGLIPLHRSLGVNYGILAPDGEVNTMKLRQENTGDQSDALEDLLKAPGTVMTANRNGPLTWQEGKAEAFRIFNPEPAKPFLVAGDSPNDFAMQFLTPHDCGARVRIAKDPAHVAKRHEATVERAAKGAWAHSVEDDLSAWLDIDPQPWRDAQ